MFASEIVPRALRDKSSRTASWFAAAAAACLLVAIAVIAWPGSANSAPPRVVVLGSIGAAPPPNCPGTTVRGCVAIGRVTGIQSIGAGVARPFEAPFDGRIISWSITLSRPKQPERKFFNGLFDTPPQARISVLRRIANASPPQFRLVRQSPIQILNPYLGQTVEFALEHPLVVLQDQIVALTVPTWAPAFATSAACEESAAGGPVDPVACEEFTDANQWRASREADKCSSSQADIALSRPHQKIGAKREYGCYFTAARLLYTATVVKQPETAGNPPPGGN